MSEQHTPGPWSKGHRGMDEWWIGPSDEATGLPLPVAYVDRDHPQADENTRLIVAAPSLLEALRELLRIHDKAAGFSPTLLDDDQAFAEFLTACQKQTEAAAERARAAIAAATGEQQ